MTVAYKGVTLVVTVKGGRAWIKVWVDGKIDPGIGAAGQVISNGKTLTFTGRASIEVRTGSSGVTYFTLNGTSLGALGKSGVPGDLAVRAARRRPKRRSGPDRGGRPSGRAGRVARGRTRWTGDRRTAARLGERCLALDRRVATVESCTGGLVGHLITEVPGSSAWFVGGFVTYSNALKRAASASAHEVLEAHGAVSAQVAMAMATGGRDRTGADLAVAVTGIAGPDGGTPAKPVGLTYVAVADAVGVAVKRHVWSGDRQHEQAPQRGGGARPPARTGRGLGVTSAAERVGAGLAPSRPARPIRTLRAHPRRRRGRRRRERGGAAGLAGGRRRVAAATRAARRPTRRRSTRSGSTIEPTPRSGATSRGRPHPDRLAVTKALTAIDPDNPELAAARAAGIPLEPWQQVVADAAVGRTLVGVAGTHGKSTTVGLAGPRAGRGRRGSVGVRRGAAAGGHHRRHAGDRALGQRRRVRRRGRRVRRQLRRLPAGRSPS